MWALVPILISEHRRVQTEYAPGNSAEVNASR
jgi:hypothetical protein